MATGNRMLISVLGIVILVGVAAAFALDWAGRTGGAAFLALGTTALGVLCPSPLRQAGGDGDLESSGAPEGKRDG